MNEDTVAGTVKEWMGRAKAAWGEFTDDELVKIEGRADKLSGLIQQKYGKSREAADIEAREFFERHRP